MDEGGLRQSGAESAALFVVSADAAEEAANAFHRRFPRRSAKRVLHVTQGVALLALGYALWRVASADLELLLACILALAWAVFAAAIIWRWLAAGSLRPLLSRLAEHANGEAWPTYTILCPLYREAEVTRDLVAALTRLDYPAHALDVKLLVESDDLATLAAAQETALDAPIRIEIIALPPMRPRTKPKALNVGLAQARGAFVVVYDAEDRPHRLQLRAAGMCGISLRPQDSERIIGILNALVPALEGKGITFTAEGTAMRAARGGDDAVFRLAEILIKEPHIPTPEEVAAEEKRQKRISKETGWSTYAFSNPRAYPDFDWVRKGQFTLAFDSNGSGARRTWSDGKTQTLETLLPAIVAGFDVFLIRAKAQREDREERSRQYEEMQRRRALFRQRGEREKKRTERIATLVATFDEIDALERVISRLDPAPDTQSSRLLAYTRDRLATIQALLSPDGLEAKLTADGLFPDPDPLHDPLGDPPGGYYW